ncbi:MAG: hypothetical protein A2015_08570 [Spirochaetes bacterium GWF1_31_7]|nr:MAG: hypothetical protein A2Y30_07090 [Spirochaetes bacterium GWE1_32_154]OHD47977.1 MAG: hypothetical protein A2015_08570 [Spirochaetes bacterium GWF1_31_7]OHD48068.1 MAG: hypothetical protein A2Y29_07905 [Spirochaetes bacterium GWE2_31_10]OHD81201.1 MAG: hypothetical protein A2355_00340 [Spirochaetes bacterium RIFOXYB1_FULL_32_8]HBI36401.1 hypothetical protein [Spirochaetia bacterium]
MNIFVNGDKLDFELEAEKSAFDVVNALSEYYSHDQPQKFITSIVINEKEYSYADDNGLKNMKVEDIEKIEFEFNDIVGVSLLSIKQISLYLDFISEVTENNIWDEAYLKVIDSLNWMKQGVNQIVTIFGTEKDDLSTLKNRFLSRYQNLETLFQNLSEIDFPLENDKKGEILLSIKDVQVVLQTFFNSLKGADKNTNRESIAEDIDVVVEMLEKLIPVLPSVPVSLQKGDDRGAMEIVQMLTTSIDKSISLFMIFKDTLKDHFDNLLVNGESIEVFFGKMTDNLRELMQAMETKDSVMMGDLVEYEFVPHAEELKNLLVKLKDKTLINVN